MWHAEPREGRGIRGASGTVVRVHGEGDGPRERDSGEGARGRVTGAARETAAGVHTGCGEGRGGYAIKGNGGRGGWQQGCAGGDVDGVCRGGRQSAAAGRQTMWTVARESNDRVRP